MSSTINTVNVWQQIACQGSVWLVGHVDSDIFITMCWWKLGNKWSSVFQCYYIAQAAIIKIFSWHSASSVNKFVTIILPLFIKAFNFLTNCDLKDFILFSSLIFHLCHVLCAGGKCSWVQWFWLPGCNMVFSYCREYVTGNSWNILQLLDISVTY